MSLVLAASFIDGREDLITAVGVIVAALVLVALLDRILRRWSRTLTARMTGGSEFSRATTTRLAFARRLVEALIVAVAIAIALSQFGALDKLGTTILASSAITAAVVGFAARQTLANAIAGLLIAAAQPVRVGDVVAVEDFAGTVEEVGLVYTALRTGSDSRVVIPNERLVTAIVRNDTLRSPSVTPEATIWIDTGADTEAALAALGSSGTTARISAMTADGIELLLAGAPVTPSERLRREGELRREGLAALRAAGIR
ncbi:MAG: mechanosensitive ion channel domain-containing protein [Baekduia sp.]